MKIILERTERELFFRKLFRLIAKTDNQEDRNFLCDIEKAVEPEE